AAAERNAVERAQRDAALAQQLVDQRQQLLGLAASRFDPPLGEPLAVGEHDRRAGSRRLDREQLHEATARSAPAAGASVAANASASADSSSSGIRGRLSRKSCP